MSVYKLCVDCMYNNEQLEESQQLIINPVRQTESKKKKEQNKKTRHK